MRIKIVLPVFEANAELTEDEKVIYKFLSKTMLKPISEIAPYIPFGKSKTTQLLKAMGEKGVVAIEGKGRGTKYRIKWEGYAAMIKCSLSSTAVFQERGETIDFLKKKSWQWWAGNIDVNAAQTPEAGEQFDVYIGCSFLL